MNCRDAKAEIALHLGHDDVDSSRWEEVRRHVSTCAPCRAHYKRLKAALTVLEQADPPITYETHGSLWPELVSRLDSQPRREQAQAPRRWLPYASFAVASLLFLTVWVYQPTVPTPPAASPMGRQSLPVPSSWSADRQHQRDAGPSMEREEESPETDL